MARLKLFEWKSSLVHDRDYNSQSFDQKIKPNIIRLLGRTQIFNKRLGLRFLLQMLHRKIYNVGIRSKIPYKCNGIYNLLFETKKGRHVTLFNLCHVSVTVGRTSIHLARLVLGI